MGCVVFWLPVDEFYLQSDEKWRLLAQGSQVYLIVKEMVIDYTWSFHPQFIKDNSNRGKNVALLGKGLTCISSLNACYMFSVKRNRVIITQYFIQLWLSRGEEIA